MLRRTKLVTLVSRLGVTCLPYMLRVGALLLVVAGLHTRHASAVFPVGYNHLSLRYPAGADRWVAVIALHESDCLQYLWFARQVRLRREELGVGPPLVLLLTEWPWQSKATRSTVQVIRLSGFEVRVSTTRSAPWLPRHAAPALMLLDRSRRVRAAFPLPASPNEMYAIIRAAQQLPH